MSLWKAAFCISFSITSKYQLFKLFLHWLILLDQFIVIRCLLSSQFVSCPKYVHIAQLFNLPAKPTFPVRYTFVMWQSDMCLVLVSVLLQSVSISFYKSNNINRLIVFMFKFQPVTICVKWAEVGSRYFECTVGTGTDTWRKMYRYQYSVLFLKKVVQYLYFFV